MDDYTPPTEDVRESYTYFRGTIPTVEHEAEFDAWLAEHDAEIREQAAQEIEAEAFRYAGDFEGGLFYAATIVRGV